MSVVGFVACSDNDHTINITVDGGNDGAADGAAGAPGFAAFAPCNTVGDFVTANVITVDPNTVVYTPACVKVATGSTVTIGASTIHPLSGTTDGSPNNPIPMHQTTPQTVTFTTPGFFTFECDVHASVGMKGVVWVTP